MHILVADDSSTQRLILKSILKSIYKNSEIAEATSGEEALAQVKQRQFQLVFSDINMEPMNGFDFVSEAMPLAPDAVFIFVTSLLTDAARERAKSMGVTHFVTKPITPDSLKSLLEKIPL